jgi:rubrerythrin
LILAYGRRAEEEGYPEIASALYRIADEKARQAAEWFTLARSPDGTGENLHRQMRREEAGAKTCLKMAGEARKAGDTEVALFYERTAAEGRRHEAVVRALLRRFFGG